MSRTRFIPAPSQMPKEAFVRIFGGVYEHSPWIAEQAWQQGLAGSDDTPQGLAARLSEIVSRATPRQQLTLIRAHPDLAGKVARAGRLTTESSQEQAGAGIDQCSDAELARFEALNRAYRNKFQFPFIMAIKGCDRQQILQAFEQRLGNDYAVEFAQALQQIHNIARFRLEEIAQSET